MGVVSRATALYPSPQDFSNHWAPKYLNKYRCILVFISTAICSIGPVMHFSEDAYVKGESLSFLPWDDDFYEAVDALIHKAVAEAIASLERCLFKQVAEEHSKQSSIGGPSPDNSCALHPWMILALLDSHKINANAI